MQNQLLIQDNLPLGALCHRMHCQPCKLSHEAATKKECVPDQASKNNSTVFSSVTLTNFHPIHDKTSLHNVGKNPAIQTVSIIDSGNLFGTAIHPKLAAHLAVDISPGTACVAALATGSSQARVHGRVRYPLQLTIGDTVTFIRPWVVAGLSIPLNLSLYWLRDERARLDFNTNTLHLASDKIALTTAMEALMFRPPANQGITILPTVTKPAISNIQGKDDISKISSPGESGLNEYRRPEPDRVSDPESSNPLEPDREPDLSREEMDMDPTRSRAHQRSITRKKRDAAPRRPLRSDPQKVPDFEWIDSDEKEDGRFKGYFSSPGIISLRPLEQKVISMIVPRLPPGQGKILVETALTTAPYAIPAGIYHCENGLAQIMVSNWNTEEKLRLLPNMLIAAVTPVVDQFTETPYLQAMTTDVVSAKDACQQDSSRDFDPEVSEMLKNVKVPGEGHLGSIQMEDGDEEKDNKQLRKELEGFTRDQLDQWMREQFRFQDSPFLSTDPELAKKVLSVLREYSDVISVSKSDYGKTDVLMAHLRLKDPHTNPYRGKVKPINPSQEASLKKQIEDWLAEGVIQPSESPWNAPLVPALKKSGAWRWCLNYTVLNSRLIPDAHPLSNIMSNIHRLAGSRIFSLLDGTGAYHNVSLTPPSRPLTAFGYHGGHFQFVRLPFGLSSAPAIYSRLVDTILSYLPPEVRKTTLPYLDDLLIHTSSTTQHVDSLAALLDVHRRAKMKISPSKSNIFRK